MIADTKALTLALEKEEGRIDGAGCWGKPPILPLRLVAVPSKYNWAGVHSHKCLEMDPAKK
jgi:hypothetical protein